MNWSKMFLFSIVTDYLIECMCLMALCFYYCKTLAEGRNRRKPPGPKHFLPWIGHWSWIKSEPYKKLAQMKAKYGNIIGLKMLNKYTVFLNEENIIREVFEEESIYAGVHGHLWHLDGFDTANGMEWEIQWRYCLTVSRELNLKTDIWKQLCKIDSCPIKDHDQEANCHYFLLLGKTVPPLVANLPTSMIRKKERRGLSPSNESTYSVVQQLAFFNGQPVDIREILDTIVCDELMSCLMGPRLDYHKSEMEIKCIKELKKALRYYGPTTAGTLIPKFRKFCEYFQLLGYDKARQKVLNFRKLISEKVDRHSSSSYSMNGHLINYYCAKFSSIDLQNPAHYCYCTGRKIAELVAIMYLEGSDTVIFSLAWLFRLMAKYPDVQDKVHKELDQITGLNGIISYDRRHKIPYTFAVVQESLRMASIMPSAAIIRSFKDFKIRNFTIPKKSVVIPNVWAVNHDPKIWSNPEEFQPERFLECIGYGFLALSIGRGACPSEDVNWMLLTSLFTGVMNRFKVCAPNATAVHFDVSESLEMQLKPQPLQFLRRSI